MQQINQKYTFLLERYIQIYHIIYDYDYLLMSVSKMRLSIKAYFILLVSL